ncbi:CDP-archaeol synthase [Lyngbya sp. CCY1209]|uniref:CDP-archaeol synthase n=1 Tax=Lyngbya sp. CCY1209 TaxID=2886103 RepID=UPI002D21098C|nr:CDP-archaeol synthase [Lyngbya sp. CCY1209]MEB3883419.1 CDP-archaeol synthase [Lyngbya sp. CCY1209]
MAISMEAAMREVGWLSTLTLDTLNLIWIASALFLAGVLEAFLWKMPPFQWLNFPIQRDWFGANKRWRGLVSLPLTFLVGVILFQQIEGVGNLNANFPVHFRDLNAIQFGLLTGFVFNLSELPNSYIKRRLQIPPGDESNPIFYVVDHVDSTYGVLILWYFYFQFPAHFIGVGLAVTPLLFMGATALRKRLGLK